jgi:hypothetical protein
VQLYLSAAASTTAGELEKDVAPAEERTSSFPSGQKKALCGSTCRDDKLLKTGRASSVRAKQAFSI